MRSLLVAVPILIALSSSDSIAAKPKIAFQELRGEPGTEALRVQQVSFQVCSELNRAGFEAICAHELLIASRKNPAAKAFQACSDQTCYLDRAKALGADYVVHGTVRHEGKKHLLTLELLDVSKRKWSGNGGVEGTSVAELIGKIPSAVSALGIGKSTRK